MRDLTNSTMETRVIINPKIGRALLKLGYEIIDIKPSNTIKFATVFVFKAEGNFEEDKQRLINEMKTKATA